MPEERYLQAAVAADLAAKMVFVAGPRQVGKTTLAKARVEGRADSVYLNWDNRDDRRTIRAARWPAAPSLGSSTNSTNGAGGSGGSRGNTMPIGPARSFS